MDKISEAIKNMSDEERQELAKRMYNPLRCGGCRYVNGKPHYIIGGVLRSPKEVNDIKRAMNPLWSEEAIKPYLLDEE